MALNINGRMKVKTLRADFKKEFGLTLRVYDGRSFADDDATLASIRKGDSVGGEFAPQRNTKVGNLEDKIMDMFGIKTQVAGSDDSYLCDNDLTLAGALEADEKLMGKRAKRKVKSSDAPVETASVTVNDAGTNKVGVLCLDWDNDEIVRATTEAPKLFIFGFFVDETDYEEDPDEEAFYGLKAYVMTGDNGSGFYAGWLVDNYYFADEVDEMEDGQFPDDMLTEKYPEEMKRLRELVAKYSAFPESAGGGFPEGCMLSEDDIDDPAEQAYLINDIDDVDNLVSQYVDKVGDIDLEEMPEDTFNLNFPFLEEELDWADEFDD